ncbi:MAG: hypothetical protein SFU98_03580 [Leptospiraceae bacterium]|nr:hypothetical protein [Leptospiraceae bacterium]
MKKENFFLLSLFVLIGLSHLLFLALVSYTEKNSYLWELARNRKIPIQNYELGIIGDSQFLSGIIPSKLGIPVNKILFLARPAEMPESIYLRLLELKKEKNLPKKILINLSPITTSKNEITESNRNLVQNFSSFSFEILYNKRLSSFYLKNLTGGIKYILSSIFPVLKLRSNLITEMKLIPSSERIDLSSRILTDYLEIDPIQNLLYQKSYNEKIKIYQEKNHYSWNWSGNTSCFPMKTELSSFLNFVFSNYRKESLEMYIEIGNLLKENNIEFLFVVIPFEKKAMEIVGFENKLFPLETVLQKLELEFGKDKIYRVDKEKFLTEHFFDFTHLNFCGMNILTNELSERLRRN